MVRDQGNKQENICLPVGGASFPSETWLASLSLMAAVDAEAIGGLESRQFDRVTVTGDVWGATAMARDSVDWTNSVSSFWLD